MKEVTYEDWLKNPIPREMWVWDTCESAKSKKKVIYIADNISFPVMTIINNNCYNTYKHCAEIEKTRRMTNQELAWWLRDGKHREYKFRTDIVYSLLSYSIENADKPVHNNILIRENGGEWHEPLVEVKE